MGITHYAILNQLIGNGDFVFIDPNVKINYLAKRNLSARVLSSDNGVIERFDFALICTPPIFHIPILRNCISKKVSNIFVEKPFGGINDDFSGLLNTESSIKIGYVLRFNPIVQWVKNNIDIFQVTKVEGYYFSNTIETKPKGWRNSSYSGVTNEVGAHIIDLCIYLFGLSKPTVINKQIKSVISDVDDILIADLEENHIRFHMHFDWVNKSYRKPVFKFIITMRDQSILKFDQQIFEHYRNNKLVNKISVVDLARQVPFYMRGVDFTYQMEDFIGDQKDISTLEDALTTRDIIKNLIS